MIVHEQKDDGYGYTKSTTGAPGAINPDCGGTHCIPGEVDKWKALAGQLFEIVLKRAGNSPYESERRVIAKAREAGL